MTRLDINRAGEMEVFVRVIELGGFSAAARDLGLTPSAVSKLVARLEARLGARLVNRSTRGLQLTAEGCAFYERGLRVLADLDEAERSAALAAMPRGRLRINANVPFGKRYLLPLIPEFLARYPEVSVNLVLTDHVVDLLEDRTDVAIRTGALKSSGLVARKLGATRMMIVAAPAYLARRGRPQAPADLARHNLLGFSFPRETADWPLMEDGRQVMVAPSGNAQAGDGDTLHQLALAGLGLARLATFQVAADVDAGLLLPVLEQCNPGDTQPIHAVYLGQGGHLPARVRALLDFLAGKIRIE